MLPDFAPFFDPKVPYLGNHTEFEDHPSIEILGNTSRFVVGWVADSLDVFVWSRSGTCAPNRGPATGCEKCMNALVVTPTEA